MPGGPTTERRAHLHPLSDCLVQALTWPPAPESAKTLPLGPAKPPRLQHSHCSLLDASLQYSLLRKALRTSVRLGGVRLDALDGFGGHCAPWPSAPAGHMCSWCMSAPRDDASTMHCSTVCVNVRGRCILQTHMHMDMRCQTCACSSKQAQGSRAAHWGVVLQGPLCAPWKLQP